MLMFLLSHQRKNGPMMQKLCRIKNSMTPSMKDFMKRLERKDSQVSSIGENVNEDVCDEKNEGPLVQRKFFFQRKQT